MRSSIQPLAHWVGDTNTIKQPQEETDESRLAATLTSDIETDEMGAAQSRMNVPPTPKKWSESVWQGDDTRSVINRAVIPYLLTAMKCVHFLQPEKPLHFIGDYINTVRL